MKAYVLTERFLKSGRACTFGLKVFYKLAKDGKLKITKANILRAMCMSTKMAVDHLLFWVVNNLDAGVARNMFNAYWADKHSRADVADAWVTIFNKLARRHRNETR